MQAIAFCCDPAAPHATLRFEKALNRGDFDCPVRPLPPQLTSLQDHLSARGFDQARIDIILPGLREVSLVLK